MTYLSAFELSEAHQGSCAFAAVQERQHSLQGCYFSAAASASPANVFAVKPIITIMSILHMG